MESMDPEEYERSAAGLDYEEPARERAASYGASMADKGPEALFEEIENLLPESWREHIASFPISAMLLGFGAGIFLGMRKGDEIIAAGSAFVTSTAMANVQQVMSRVSGGE